MTTINEMRESEKLRTGLLIGIQAGAATVGRPKGRNGKNLAPRRAVVTPKEAESLRKQHEVPHGSTTVDMANKRIKVQQNKGKVTAGGPGSGRRPLGGSRSVTTAQTFGYNTTKKFRDAGTTVMRHKNGDVLRVQSDGSWTHLPQSGGYKDGKNWEAMHSHLTKVHGDK